MPGDGTAFALHHGVSWQAVPEPIKAKDIEKRLADTQTAWESWSDLHQRYQGPWRELVHQSGRVLKGLTYHPPERSWPPLPPPCPKRSAGPGTGITAMSGSGTPG